MKDTLWWKKTVIYELYVDKFAGNFAGLTARLDYFVYMGIETIWILPHFPSPMVDDGYDISDYTGIRPELGTMEDFDQFLSAAHSRGLKVIVDIVLNHTSDQHPWFREARQSRDNPKRNWYLWDSSRDRFSQAFVHFSHVKDRNWIWNEATGDYYYATFYPQQPDLNWDNPEVVDAMYGVIDFWLEKGVDGFRLDAIARLIKRDNTNCFGLPETHQVLKNLRRHVSDHYPQAVILAESGGWVDEARGFFGNGDECQLVLNFPLAVNMLASVCDRNLGRVDYLRQQAGGIPDGCQWAVFLTNHDSVDLFFLGSDDEKRMLAGRTDPGGRFTLPEGQSMGARLGEVCQGNPDDIIWATDLLLSQPGTPVIYYGNELGMRNEALDPKPGDVRLFVRGAFDWAQVDIQKNDPYSILNRVRHSLLHRKSLGLGYVI